MLLTEASTKESILQLQAEGESPPTYGGDDSTTEEGSGGQVPVAGEVLRKAAYIQTRLHRRRHSLHGRDVKHMYTLT